MTTNYQLADAAERNCIPLVGIYFKNRLPDVVQPGGYIFNLADDGEEGTHWTSAWVEKQGDGKLGVVYFDPFGLSPPENVKHFFSGIDTDVPYIKKQVQNIVSFICGYYVLYFLYYMSHTKAGIVQKLRRFEMLWSQDPSDNRRLLEEYLKALV